MNHENNQEINLRQFLSLRAFKELLKNPPNDFSNRIGEEGFLEIANFLSNIPPEDKLNPMAMFQHISSYVYQEGHEVFKEFYLQTYKTINSEHIQYVVKKTGDPDDEADGPSITKQMLENEGRDACQDLQKWETEMKQKTKRATEDDNKPAS
ncbi:hypothetical protein [Laspinema palackyanum]|uniref:hypothetical protein n=1 Tax=Laspinema palackyanum TaxID=3231601 RepID=UPI00345D9A69|nr:hypothetical protein [Laspinema sp. D2c]